jgi:hypothetical protein
VLCSSLALGASALPSWALEQQVTAISFIGCLSMTSTSVPLGLLFLQHITIRRRKLLVFCQNWPSLSISDSLLQNKYRLEKVLELVIVLYPVCANNQKHSKQNKNKPKTPFHAETDKPALVVIFPSFTNWKSVNSRYAIWKLGVIWVSWNSR